MPITYGLVPHPPYRNRPIWKPDGFGQDDLGQRTVKGVVWHRMIGSLEGTYQHFTNPNVGALTDYGVGVLAQDGAALDGVIDRYNDPLGRQSGWASGSFSSAAYGDGIAFVNKYGINAINRDQASIEISGLTYDVPLSPKAIESVCQITAYWADRYRIPWNTFPVSPADGFSFVRWHNEFGPDNGTKKCPGKVVMEATPAMIARVSAILKQYQEGAVTPVPDDLYPEGMDEGIAEMLFGPAFNPNGPLSKIWLARGKATGEWPKYLGAQSFGDRTYYKFEGGIAYWRTGNGSIKELK